MTSDISRARIERIRETITAMQAFRFCGPSDDPDEISAVTLGYRHLLIQLQRSATPLLPDAAATHLNSLEVEPSDLYSAFNANAEIDALILDIEEAIEAHEAKQHPNQSGTPSEPLPTAVCSIVGQVLGSTIYHHKTLENLFYRAGARGEVPDGNCVTKCQTWLRRLHNEVQDPIRVLGKVIEEFMEVDNPRYHPQDDGRREISEVLARYGMTYDRRGLVLNTAAAISTKTLLDHLQERKLDSVQEEFERSLRHAIADPAAAVTAASSTIESMCKVYLEDRHIPLPTKQDISHLWRDVSNHVGFDPGSKEDNDVKKVLSGLVSVVTGIGALRTHAGSAHGRGRKRYKLQPRHARLAIHASHTIIAFLLETTDAQTG